MTDYPEQCSLLVKTRRFWNGKTVRHCATAAPADGAAPFSLRQYATTYLKKSVRSNAPPVGVAATGGTDAAPARAIPRGTGGKREVEPAWGSHCSGRRLAPASRSRATAVRTARLCARITRFTGQYLHALMLDPKLLSAVRRRFFLAPRPPEIKAKAAGRHGLT